MAFDAFLYFDPQGGVAAKPIDGESLDVLHKNWVEISEFSFGIENNLNITSKSGGAGAGKATFKEFTVKKQTDTASCNLVMCCCLGGHYGQVSMDIRKSGSSATMSGAPYLTYQFYMVAVQSVSWSGADGDDVPEEEVVFEYGAIAMNYSKQEAKGNLTPYGEASWSIVKNNNTTAVE